MLDKTPLHKIVDRTTLEPWRKLLLDAADYMETHGMLRRSLRNRETGAVCTRGAIMAVKGFYGDRQLFGWLVSTVEEKEADGHLSRFINGNVPIWNNHKAKDCEGVVSTMRACALQDIY